MNKLTAFCTSFVAAGFAYWFINYVAGKEVTPQNINEVAFLIFWYMLWKLFHKKT